MSLQQVYKLLEDKNHVILIFNHIPSPYHRIWYIIAAWCERASRSVMSDSLWPHGLFSLWNFPGQNTGVGSRSLLQGIFPIQESNWGLLHCRRILYQLSYQGSPSCLTGLSMWLVVKNPPANAGDTGSTAGLKRSAREGNGKLHQYSCLENPMNTAVW